MKSGICLLIVPVPVHCFSLTFMARISIKKRGRDAGLIENKASMRLVCNV